MADRLMDSNTALIRLKSMTAWDQIPALTPEEITDLLDYAKRIDPAGIAPTSTDWTATFDLNSAAAEGWRWKAAKVSGKFAFTTSGQAFSRDQMSAMCLLMADRYQARVLVSVRMRSGLPIIRPPVVLVPTDEPFLP